MLETGVDAVTRVRQGPRWATDTDADAETDTDDDRVNTPQDTDDDGTDDDDQVHHPVRRPAPTIGAPQGAPTMTTRCIIRFGINQFTINQFTIINQVTIDDEGDDDMTTNLSPEYVRFAERQRQDREAEEQRAAREAEERKASNERARRAYMERLETAEAEKRTAREAEELAKLTEQLKVAYMAQPGATPELFARALPDLLEEHRRREALEGRERLLDEGRRSGRYSL